ncbi:putative apoptosis-inducing factor [Aspergillus karnatakaensis]|uniref:NAD(P)/FAD-dependent oxidoreductase n=1 Tax=Aspergillus karnatakaensis TaxID=1810916 RepID=UPI003CCDC30C
MKHIVIVGGSFAGVSTAHQILRQVNKSNRPPTVKVTLVSRDTHFYWNIASPRAIACASDVPDETLFASIKGGFAKYPKAQFEFVLGSAVGLDLEAKVLQVSGGLEVKYDILVIGTGADTAVPTPLKSRGSTESTKEALHEYQEQVKTANSILVAGAGPTGVELAGELSYQFGSEKKIILVLDKARVLAGPGRPDSLFSTAESHLRSLNVDIRPNTKVETAKKQVDGTWEFTTSLGNVIKADMYIPTFGVKPNSSFLPREVLDNNGFVQVDHHLVVKGTKNVYALGDVSSLEPPQFVFVKAQSTYLANSIVLQITGREGSVVPYKPASSAMMGLQVGRKLGVGHYGSWRVPGILVAYMRKTLFVEDLPRTVDGSAF